eukprot:TRINITY_DN17713_c0_g1_i1.p1 TRINITY_DN17713_c0_g1~~TRINITY_DN17713_c0_g1_i1.p1  ORF type:complete len:377 (+),score=79.15 TRINITY_DN17713_c0_g1_i1:50-1132(+)
MRHTRCVLAVQAPLENPVKRRTLEGRPTAELLNQYNPAVARQGSRPYGVHDPADIEQYRLRYRQRLPTDELNPVIHRNWRRYELLPKENRNNPDSFHYEHFKHGGKAYQQVYHEDLLRLMKYPEKNVLVVDTRSDFSQVKQHIPFSVRIPMEEVTYALQLAEGPFQKMYGFAPPQQGVEIICVSHNGIGSEKALKEFERWGHPADHLYNFRAGTNLLFGENLSDFGSLTEDVDVGDFKSVNYPLFRPDYLSEAGPFAPKYSPYPPEELDELLRRDNEGTWKVDKPADAASPVGKYAKTRREFQQTIDSLWLRARMVADVKWYDFKHREPFTRWREPDLSHDRAFRPGTHQYWQFWRSVPQ